MTDYVNWILDFDDTLAVGPMTWAIETLLPEFMQAHKLTIDPALRGSAILRAQAFAARDDANIAQLIDGFVAEVGWKDAEVLKADLQSRVESGFTYRLFDDALPFLQQLAQMGRRVLIMSNNSRAPQLAVELDITYYVQRVLTPDLCFGCSRKPDRSMFDYVRNLEPGLQIDNTIVVGDDPWSEAAFATNCGLPCIILDRRERYKNLPLPANTRRIRSLRDLM
ncbi:MAG: HAD family hydrolase [Anaerolineae bacterium]|nr:HAD family hydrolase [Anaerolineae bacterium]